MPGTAGSHGLRVRSLDRASLDRAFSLIEMAFPGIEAARWRTFARYHLAGAARGKSAARKQITSDRGILVVENDRGYLFALSAYRALPSLSDGKILLVDHVVIPKIIDQTQVLSLLTRSWENIARRNSCMAVRTLLPARRRAAKIPGANARKDLLAAAVKFGYRPEAHALIKPVV